LSLAWSEIDQVELQLITIQNFNMHMKYKPINRDHLLTNINMSDPLPENKFKTYNTEENPTNTGKKGNKLPLIKSEKELEETIQKYDALMQELFHLHKTKVEYRTPLELGKFGCIQCDPLFKLYLQSSSFTKALIFLKKQLTFIPSQEIVSPTLQNRKSYDCGVFEYQRNHKGIFKYFPSGKNIAASTTNRHSIKFAQPKYVNCQKELNYRLRLDYESGRLITTQNLLKQNPNIKLERWQFKYLGILIVLNQQSRSTPLRMVTVPNRPLEFSATIKELKDIGYNVQQGEMDNDVKKFSMTYNDTILNYSTNLPSVLFAHIRYLVSTVILIADLSDFFKCIKYAPETSIGQQALFFTDNEGVPVISNESHGAEMTEFCYTFQNYGQNDSPISSQVALILGIKAFVSHAVIKINDYLLPEIEKFLLQIYVDDYCISSVSDHVLQFMLHMPMIMTVAIDCDVSHDTICTICQHQHNHTDILPNYWKQPKYPNNVEGYIPFNCPILRN